MRELNFDGFTTSTNPIEDGDVSVVIRRNGNVEVAIKSADENGHNPSANSDDLLTAYGLVTLLSQTELMKAARANAFEKIQDAMTLRVVN